MNTENDIAQVFVQRYLGEYDFCFARPDVPIFESFIPDVTQIVEYLTAGAIGAVGRDLYDAIKHELFSRHRSVLTKRPTILLKRGEFNAIKVAIDIPKNGGTFLIKGEERDATILQAGKLRPFFRIGKDSILLLHDVIIEYEGSPVGLIEEEKAPSFFTSNVVFRQKRT